MFSVTFPPENSQYNRQLINWKGSNSRSGRPVKKAFQLTFCAVQSGGNLRTQLPLACGVLRLIQDSAWVSFPTIPSLIHFRTSAIEPELSCCKPICTTRSDFFASARHSSASGMDQVIVFSE